MRFAWTAGPSGRCCGRSSRRSPSRLVVIMAIFSFQGVWNDFLWPLLMAGVLLASPPLILLLLFAQRFFTAGIGAGALKG